MTQKSKVKWRVGIVTVLVIGSAAALTSSGPNPHRVGSVNTEFKLIGPDHKIVVGAIFVERKMRAGAVVVIEVRGHDAAQMALIKDHDVIQTLAANRTNHALDVCVLPR